MVPSHKHTQKNVKTCEVMDTLISLTAVITSQCIMYQNTLYTLSRYHFYLSVSPEQSWEKREKKEKCSSHNPILPCSVRFGMHSLLWLNNTLLLLTEVRWKCQEPWGRILAHGSHTLVAYHIRQVLGPALGRKAAPRSHLQGPCPCLSLSRLGISEVIVHTV